MYPHCMDGCEAARAARLTRFHPIGLRPVDGGNIDGDFCTVPLTDYMAHANAQKFVIVQIEDKEAIEHIDAIVATEGIDVVFVGPGDLSQSLGVPGQAGDPRIVAAIEAVAAACAKHGKHWGVPTSEANIRKYYDMGARFLTMGADVLGIHQYFKDGLAAALGALQ